MLSFTRDEFIAGVVSSRQIAWLSHLDIADTEPLVDAISSCMAKGGIYSPDSYEVIGGTLSALTTLDFMHAEFYNGDFIVGDLKAKVWAADDYQRKVTLDFITGRAEMSPYIQDDAGVVIKGDGIDIIDDEIIDLSAEWELALGTMLDDGSYTRFMDYRLAYQRVIASMDRHDMADMLNWDLAECRNE